MSPLYRLTVILYAWAAGGLVVMFAIGLHPILPWQFIAAMVAAPAEAWALATGAEWLSRHGCPWWLALLCGCALLGAETLGVTSGHIGQAVLIAGFLMALLLPKRINPRHVMALRGVPALIAGNVAVMAWNYPALLLTKSRLADASARAMDLAVYRALGWSDYTGIFPLLARGWTFSIIERAYLFLFFESVVILFLLADDEQRMTSYIRRLFTCNLIASLVFLCWPIVGPSLMYPESINAGVARGTMMSELAVGGLDEFRAMLSTGQPLTGYGVFIAFPSLHVAYAVLFQLSIRHLKTAWWALLPINVLLILGTVVIGQHYLIDVPSGIALGALVFLPMRLPARSMAYAQTVTQ